MFFTMWKIILSRDGFLLVGLIILDGRRSLTLKRMAPLSIIRLELSDLEPGSDVKKLNENRLKTSMQMV